MTSLSNANNAPKGRLYGSGSWCSATLSKSEYLQVDLGKIVTVAGIATQGDPTANNWVTQYTVKYSMDGSTWADYKGDAGSAKV